MPPVIDLLCFAPDWRQVRTVIGTTLRFGGNLRDNDWSPRPASSMTDTQKPIYLDYNATTPIDPAVLDAMLSWLGSGYGNPSSQHAYGKAAHTAVDKARAEVAGLIGAHADEIVFTGGGTEATNHALKGAAHLALRRAGDK